MSGTAELVNPAPRAAWWQWFFLYPAFGVALVSAIPAWADKYVAITENLGDRTVQEARAQQELFQRNLDCLQVPFFFVSMGDLKIDPILCSATGDISIRYESPTGQRRVVFVNVKDRLAQTASWNLLSPAYAGQDGLALDQPLFRSNENVGNIAPVQFSVPLVVCIKEIDSRTILRHVAENGQCFDEQIDTLTGWVTSRQPVACRNSC